MNETTDLVAQGPKSSLVENQITINIDSKEFILYFNTGKCRLCKMKSESINGVNLEIFTEKSKRDSNRTLLSIQGVFF